MEMAMTSNPALCTMHKLKVNGETRSYWLHKPVRSLIERSADILLGEASASEYENPLHPLILVLHGSFMTSKQMMDFSALTELADKHNCLLVYPDMSYFWQWDVPAGFSNKDAVFLERLIVHLIETGSVDGDRVYATGFSSGADILHLLACSSRLSSLITAFAPVCSNLDRTWAKSIEHDVPTSILMINGTHDKFNRWEGDKRWMSVAETFEYWQNHNRIASTGKSNLPGTISPVEKLSKTTAHFIQSFDQVSGSEVSLLKIDGGGHMWPSQKEEKWLTKMVLGRKHNQHLATSVIWSFFERHKNKKKKRP
jgi:polyhydroxybutyrate depolymerase